MKNIQRRCSEIRLGIGDDACLLKDGTILTTDSFLEGVHFDLKYFDYQTLGERIACATLSDIAAMAGKPILILAALYLPKEMTTKELLSLYQGIENICRRYNCEIGGGDIVSSKRLGITLSALGKTDKPVLRSGARPKDRVFVTGYLGLAETGRKTMNIKSGYRNSRARHLRPLPRIKEAWQLRTRLNSLIDTSDGLATDVNHLARESGVKIKIFWDKLPIHPETIKLCRKRHWAIERFVLSSGEDFELLFTTQKEMPKTIQGLKISEIGICEKGRGVFLIKEGGKEYPCPPIGYDHLWSRSISF